MFEDLFEKEAMIQELLRNALERTRSAADCRHAQEDLGKRHVALSKCWIENLADEFRNRWGFRKVIGFSLVSIK